MPDRENINSDLLRSGLSPSDLYSAGVVYYSELFRSLGQIGLYMLDTYARQGVNGKPYSGGYPSFPLISDDNKGVGKVTGSHSLTGREDVFSSFKNLTESYLETNAPSVLKALLEVICLAYSSNFNLRTHIRNISAKYQFTFNDQDVPISLEIKNGGMRTFRGNCEIPDVRLKFKDPGSFRKLLFTAKPDILEMILKQEVAIDGNLNYLLKFIYLLRHLQLKLTGIE
jgi:hypothetical protein